MARFLKYAAILAFAIVPYALAPALASGICPANNLGHASSVITTFPYTIGGTDICKTKVFNTAVGSQVIKIPAPGTGGDYLPNFPVTLLNIGTQPLTLTPQANAAGSTPTINGVTTMPLTPQQGGILAVGADGNWYFMP